MSEVSPEVEGSVRPGPAGFPAAGTGELPGQMSFADIEDEDGPE